MKYNMSKIMRRAWEIKRDAEWEVKHQLINRNIFRELYQEEKAIFSECLKMAWEEAKKSAEYTEKYNVTEEMADRMAAKENELKGEKVTWNIWAGYGLVRAYYHVSSWSKYQNSKKTNYV